MKPTGKISSDHERQKMRPENLDLVILGAEMHAHNSTREGTFYADSSS